jgi:hypothetical protein
MAGAVNRLATSARDDFEQRERISGGTVPAVSGGDSADPADAREARGNLEHRLALALGLRLRAKSGAK